jgi:hypothetical protein
VIAATLLDLAYRITAALYWAGVTQETGYAR